MPAVAGKMSLIRGSTQMLWSGAGDADVRRSPRKVKRRRRLIEGDEERLIQVGQDCLYKHRQLVPVSELKPTERILILILFPKKKFPKF